MNNNSRFDQYDTHLAHKRDYDEAHDNSIDSAIDLWNVRDDARLVSGELPNDLPEVIAAQQTHDAAVAHEAGVLALAKSHNDKHLDQLRAVAQMEAQADGMHIEIEQFDDPGTVIPVIRDLQLT